MCCLCALLNLTRVYQGNYVIFQFSLAFRSLHGLGKCASLSRVCNRCLPLKSVQSRRLSGPAKLCMFAGAFLLLLQQSCISSSVRIPGIIEVVCVFAHLRLLQLALAFLAHRLSHAGLTNGLWQMRLLICKCASFRFLMGTRAVAKTCQVMLVTCVIDLGLVISPYGPYSYMHLDKHGSASSSRILVRATISAQQVQEKYYASQ